MRHGKRLRGRIEWLVFPHVREGMVVVVVVVLVRVFVDKGGLAIYIYVCFFFYLHTIKDKAAVCT